MRVLPSFTEQGIVLPWIDVVVYPAGWLAVFVTLFGTGCIAMDYTPIPSGELVTTVITIVLAALLLFVVLYLVDYQEKKTKVYELKARALQNGTAVDELAIAKVETFSNIYLCALLVGAAVTAGLAYLAMVSIIPNELTLVSTLDYILYSFAAVLIIGVVMDRVFIHPIADGTFDDKVIDPLVDDILAEFQDASEEGTASTLNAELVAQLISALQNTSTSK